MFNFWKNLVNISLFTFLSYQPLTLANHSPEHINQCNYSLTELSNLLVKDISDYGNRVIQKSKRRGENFESLPIYIITANQPEFEKLPLEQRQYKSEKVSEIEQVFFTTMERHYLNKITIQETENYHWLLLTPTSDGWQMVMLLSRLGVENKTRPSSPPLDTTNGIIGEAVRVWLRDCNFKPTI